MKRHLPGAGSRGEELTQGVRTAAGAGPDEEAREWRAQRNVAGPETARVASRPK